MSFSPLLDLLKRFEGIGFRDRAVEEEAVKWCVSKTNLLPEDLEIKLKQSNLIIRAKSMPAKNAVFMVQTQLLEELRRRFGSKAPQKILFG